MRKMITLIISLCCYWTSIGWSQALQIEYETPEVLNICGMGTFDYTITNQRASVLDDINVTVQLPSGIEYLPGSVVNATEVDVSNLERPIFELDIMPDASTILRFSLQTNCQLYDRVQQAASFTNELTFNHPSFNQTYVDDPPYALTTGLLVIQPIPDIRYVSGSSSQRDVFINNTRLGSIDRIRLVHEHGALDITPTQGTIVDQTNTRLEIILDSTDFKNVGNGDGFLDNNEQFIYTEILNHEKCEPEILPSEYQVYWGCENAFCQSDTFASDMIFNLTTERGRLRVQTDPLHPFCPCLPETQCMTFQNFGRAGIERLRIFLRAGSLADTLVGIVRNSYYINSGNVTIDSIIEGDSKGVFCTPQGINASDTLYISVLQPGESFELCFDFHQCREFIPAFGGESELWWNFGYDHYTVCRPNDYQFNFNNQVEMIQQLPVFTFEWDGAGEDLIEGQAYEARWTAAGDLLRDSGMIMFRSCVPCGLVEERPFSISNGAPVEFSDTTRISNNPPTDRIDYYFKLPFQEDSVVATMLLSFSCEEECLDSLFDTQVTEVESSCEVPVTYNRVMATSPCGEIYLYPCDDSLDCGYFYQSLLQTGEIICEFEGGLDTAKAYIEFESFGRRFNYGQSDANNDRRVEPNALDTSLTQRTRLGYGDTTIYFFEGDMHIDFPGTFDTLSFAVQPFYDFEGIDGYFTFKDFETGDIFECYIPELEIIGESPRTPQCCFTVITDGGFARGAAAVITPEKLAEYGCPFPDFELTEGDSVFMELRMRNISDVREITDVTSLMRVEVYDRSDPSARFSCGIGSQVFTLSFQETNFTVHGNFDFDACSEAANQGGFVFTTSRLSDNFFQNEFRQQLRFSNIFFEVQDGFIFDSLQVLVIYRDSSVLDTLLNEVEILNQNGNLRFLDSTFTANLIFDEGANVYFNPFITVESCEEVPINSDITMFMTVNAVNDFKFVKITKPFEVIDSTTDGMKRNFLVKRTEIDIEGSNATVQAFDSVFCKEFIFNFSDSLSTFFIESELLIDSNLHHQIMVDNGAEIFTVDKGVSYVDIPGKGEYVIKVCYSNNTCQDDSMDIQMYWTCSNLREDDRCYDTTFQFLVRKLDAELEMEVFSMEEELNLCDTSEWIEIELYNAELGTTYELFMDVIRGVGIDILPGSLQYQHPFGSPWENAPLPINFNGQSLRWNVIDLLDGREGLPGISEMPANRLKIRFKAITTCNYVSGGFFSFTVSGVGPCDIPTNSITKNSEIITIANAPRPLDQNISVQLEDENCSDEATVRVTLVTESPTVGDEVIDVVLPSDDPVIFDDMIPVRNIDDQSPEVIQGNNMILWRFVANQPLLTGDTVIFDLIITGLDQHRCSEVPLQFSSKTNFSQFCESIQDFCEASVVHASTDLLIDVPGISVDIVDGSIIDSAGRNFIKLSINRFFSHDTIDRDIRLTIYEDENGNGRKDSVETNKLNEGTLNSIEWEGDSICVPLEDIDNICHFMVIADGNCLCSQDTLSIYFNQVLTDVVVDTICAGDSIVIGRRGPLGAQIRWSGDPVACDTCPMNLIMSNRNLDSTMVLHFKQLFELDTDCDLLIDYTIVVLSPTSGEKDSIAICRGERVRLESGRGVVRWLGERVDTMSEDIVFRPDSSFEILAISSLENCGLVDTFCVTVLDRPSFFFVSSDTVFVFGDTIILTAETDADSIHWSPDTTLDCNNCPTVVSTPVGEVTYTIRGINKNGCNIDTQITLTPTAPPCDEGSIYIPNAFSPNGDGFNDSWYVLGNYIDQIHVVVYNRWGEKVFESFDPNKKWDGSYKGTFVTTDVFAYAVEVYCIGGERYFHKGNVTLLR